MSYGPRLRGSTSNIVRIRIPDSSSVTGAGLTGLTSSSTNLTIAFIREKDAAGTSYSGANIETISTIGTFANPSSSSKVRFKAVDATNFPGLYELHFHDSATAFGDGDTSSSIAIRIYEATTTALNIGPNALLIPLVAWNPQATMQSQMFQASPAAELSATPAAAPSYEAMLQFIYQKIRNQETSDQTQQTIAKSDGTVIATAPHNQQAGTFTRGKYV